MFMSDISIIVRKMRVVAERSSAKDLGFPEQSILMILSAKGSCNQGALATALEIDKGAVAKTVAKLEEKGLVSREVNPESKREKLVSLTPMGTEQIKGMAKTWKSLEEQLFAGLTDEQKSEAFATIALIARNASEIKEA